MRADTAAQPFAYTPDFSGLLFVLDLSSNTVVDAIRLAPPPPLGDVRSVLFDIAISPDHATAYVSSSPLGTVFVVDTVTGTVTDAVAVGSRPLGLEIAPDGRRLYVLNFGDPSISVVDTATARVERTIPLQVGPVHATVTPDGARLYVMHPFADFVSVIETATDSLIASIRVGPEPHGAIVTPDGRMVYVAHSSSGRISVIDTASHTTTSFVTGAGEAFNMLDITPDGRFLYAAQDSGDAVAVIDTSTEAVVAILPIEGAGPSGVAMSADGSAAYVTDARSDGPFVSAGTVTVIDTATNVIAQTIRRVGAGAPRIAIAPTRPQCGNGTLEKNEQCDDGNRLGGDGCAVNCTRETPRVFPLDASASRLVMHTQDASVEAPVSGSLTLWTGGPGRNGLMPVIVTAGEWRIDPVPVPGVGCFCVRPAQFAGLRPKSTAQGEIGCGGDDVLNVGLSLGQNHNVFIPDPDCFRGSREADSDPHPGVCNSPLESMFTPAVHTRATWIRSHRESRHNLRHS